MFMLQNWTSRFEQAVYHGSTLFVILSVFLDTLKASQTDLLKCYVKYCAHIW